MREKPQCFCNVKHPHGSLGGKQLSGIANRTRISRGETKKGKKKVYLVPRRGGTRGRISN